MIINNKKVISLFEPSVSDNDTSKCGAAVAPYVDFVISRARCDGQVR